MPFYWGISFRGKHICQSIRCARAALIVAIMVSYLGKTGRADLNRYAYLGSGAAVLASLVLGAIIQRTYGGLNGLAAGLFEGFASLTAVAVLTYMIFWMTRHSREIRGEF